jgi:hypothetical protein
MSSKEDNCEIGYIDGRVAFTAAGRPPPHAQLHVTADQPGDSADPAVRKPCNPGDRRLARNIEGGP